MADATAAIDRFAHAPPAAKSEPDAVAVAYVHSNDVAYSWHHCMFQMLVHDLQHGRRWLNGGTIAMRTNAGQLVQARNQAVKHLLNSDVPWMLWLDTDMGFQPDLLEQLLEAADPVDRPIVGALCFSQRELGGDGYGGYQTIPTPTIFNWANLTTDVESGEDLEGFEVRWHYPANQVVRCAGTGSAAILIHRNVFERIEVKYGQEWYHRVPARDGGMGEDLSFCMRASALDIPIHVHTGVRTTHAKQQWLSERDYLQQMLAPPATDEIAVLVPVMGRPEHAGPFMASLRASTGLATCYAVCDDIDEATLAAWKEAGASILTTSDGTVPDEPGTFAEKVNIGYQFTDEPWLLLVGSDVRFHPGWWDHARFAAGDQFHVVGTNDLGNPRVMSGEHAVHPILRRSYVDEVGASWDGPGVVAHEGYRHWFVDDEIVTAAKQRGTFVPALASRVEHLHPYFGKGDQDETYRLGQLHIDADKVLFERRLAEHQP